MRGLDLGEYCICTVNPSIPSPEQTSLPPLPFSILCVPKVQHSILVVSLIYRNETRCHTLRSREVANLHLKAEIRIMKQNERCPWYECHSVCQACLNMGNFGSCTYIIVVTRCCRCTVKYPHCVNVARCRHETSSASCQVLHVARAGRWHIFSGVSTTSVPHPHTITSTHFDNSNNWRRPTSENTAH